jgi:FkbM family methyltransferase
MGWSILTTGINDLLVTEALFRLVEPGDFAIDVGANIGYTTSCMACQVGSAGRVVSFEPHPALYAELCHHVAMWQNDSMVAPNVIQTVRAAVSLTPGEALLVEPKSFVQNRGCSSLKLANDNRPTTNRREHKASVVSLDSFLSPDHQVGVLKIDVEGHEEQVLLGARELLGRGAVRDIIFEEFKPYPAATHDLLASFGYHSFALEERLLGPRILDPRGDRCAPRFAPPNFIATRDVGRLRERFRAKSWRSLGFCGTTPAASGLDRIP